MKQFQDIQPDSERRAFLSEKFREKFGEDGVWQETSKIIAVLDASLKGVYSGPYAVFRLYDLLEFFLGKRDWYSFVFRADRQKNVRRYQPYVSLKYGGYAEAIVALLVDEELNEYENAHADLWASQSSEPFSCDIRALVSHAIARADDPEIASITLPKRVSLYPEEESAEEDDSHPMKNGDKGHMIHSDDEATGTVAKTTEPEIYKRQMTRLSGGTQVLQCARFVLEKLVEYVAKEWNKDTGRKFHASARDGMVVFGEAKDFYRYMVDCPDSPVNMSLDTGRTVRWMAIADIMKRTRFDILYIESGRSSHKLLHLNRRFFETVLGRRMIIQETPSVTAGNASVAPVILPMAETPRPSTVGMAKKQVIGERFAGGADSGNMDVLSFINVLSSLLDGAISREDALILRSRLSLMLTENGQAIGDLDKRRRELEIRHKLLEMCRQMVASAIGEGE